MEKSLWIFCCIISLFISSSYCCLASSSGGSCLVSGLSFGGRISLPDETLDLITGNSPCPSVGKRIFIFQIPRKFAKTNKRLLKLGLYGVGRMWLSKGTTCRKSTGEGNLQCRAPESQSIPCLDKGVPCHVDMTPSKYSLLRIDEHGRATVSLPENFTTPGIEGFIAEYRKVNTTEWIPEEYSDTGPKQLTGPFEEGMTYELRIRLQYDGLYCKPQLFQKFTMPCRDIDINLELSSSSSENGLANVTAKWSFRNLTAQCSVINQTVSMKRMDLDRCTVRSLPMIRSKILNSYQRSNIWTGMRANTEYRVDVTVNTQYKPHSAREWMRTLETAPSAPPKRISLSTNYRARQVDFRWKNPPCGKMNGRIVSYSVEMTRSGSSVRRNVTETQASYYGFKKGERFLFRVAAINRKGIGPYTSTFETAFGHNLF